MLLLLTRLVASTAAPAAMTITNAIAFDVADAAAAAAAWLSMMMQLLLEESNIASSNLFSLKINIF